MFEIQQMLKIAVFPDKEGAGEKQITDVFRLILPEKKAVFTSFLRKTEDRDFQLSKKPIIFQKNVY